jgi:hypothetical protein
VHAVVSRADDNNFIRPVRRIQTATQDRARQQRSARLYRVVPWTTHPSALPVGIKSGAVRFDDGMDCGIIRSRLPRRRWRRKLVVDSPMVGSVIPVPPFNAGQLVLEGRLLRFLVTALRISE